MSRTRINRVGQKFGKLTVIERMPDGPNSKEICRCLCDCGNELITLGASLQQGKTKSCGCYTRLELVGQRFGLLTVIKYQGQDPKRKNSLWLCVCDCGNESVVNGHGLRRGDYQSCGCRVGYNSHHIKHGGTGTAEYRAWKSMIQRCENPHNPRYKHYGDRNIKICSGWRKDFKNFYADMHDKPTSKHSLDRIDNDANYSCGHCDECISNGWVANCRWATILVQANNRQRTRHKSNQIKE